MLVSDTTDQSPCETCTGLMVVEKTSFRFAMTLAHGPMNVRETVRVCQDGCRFGDGTRVRRRGKELAKHVPPGHTFGYDIMVHAGLERFLRYRQREEIQRQLQQEYAIEISTGEISDLIRRFLCFLQALHEARSAAFAAALRADGGWPLHVDATCEDGRGTLLVVFTGWRQWVLAALKIPTERADAILPLLREAVERFGVPCAVMRDLGRAVRQATADLVAGKESSTRVLSCHQHFLADIGRDLLKEGHNGKLRQLFRKSRVKPKLSELVRKIGRTLGPDLDPAREGLKRWQEERDGPHRLPADSNEGLAAVRALAQWVLDHKADGTGGRFPFDRPWLDLYDRVLTMSRAADAFLRSPPPDPEVQKALTRFCRTLDAVVDEPDLERVTTALRRRAALFDELRDILRLPPPVPAGHRPSEPATPQEEAKELDDIRSELDRWVEELRKRRPSRGPAEDMRKAIDIVVEHLERHGDSLWGHAVSLPQEAGGGIRLVARTNNQQEACNRVMKRGERRRNGHKNLAQDFENLHPAVALVQNLLRPDYLSILCGSLDNLPRAFAELDAECRAARRQGLDVALPGEEPPRTVVETASLPNADRKLVRLETMGKKIRAAAHSRAQRRGTESNRILTL
jgi:hypothetical protein